MSVPVSLETLEALQGELLAVIQHRFDNLPILEQSLLEHAEAFKKLLDKSPKDKKSRDAVLSCQIEVDGESYRLNQEFAESALKLADEVDLDEIEAAKMLLEANEAAEMAGRSLMENGVIRFHRQREFLLDCMLRCIQIANDDDLEPHIQDWFGNVITEAVFGVSAAGGAASADSKRFVPRCMAAMQDIRAWIQKMADKMSSSALVYQQYQALPVETRETIDYSLRSLVTQHETLAVMLCSAVDKRHAETKDLRDLMGVLKKFDKYDHLLIHMFPALGAYMAVFGSTEGRGDYAEARGLHDLICPKTYDETWSFVALRAAVRTWWIAEYSGFYLEGALDGVDIDREDEERSKAFLESLKDGGLDFLLAMAADCSKTDWQDHGRGLWLQRKMTCLPRDMPFHDFFHDSLMGQFEVLIDATISNLPNMLRKLRTDEDEERQLGRSQEHDYSLEKILIIIANTYAGRPEAAKAFWEDPDSNLYGFLQWTSQRASTPLVSAFCDMLRALSDSEDCATDAHNFLSDETSHASGKMRRARSLTWSQMIKEIKFFLHKYSEKAIKPQAPSHRSVKPSAQQDESEGESTIMLTCYMRLMAKLAANCAETRQKLVYNESGGIMEDLLHLASIDIPLSLRAAVFDLIRSLLVCRLTQHSLQMWQYLEAYTQGKFFPIAASQGAGLAKSHEEQVSMDDMMRELATGFAVPGALIRLLTSLVSASEDQGPLHDSLPFPEDLGGDRRMPGMEPYVDYVLGTVLLNTLKSGGEDATQRRILQLYCLEFALQCLHTFNEDLLILGSQTHVAVDQAIGASDLMTYVSLHPFARVMEYMFNDAVAEAVFSVLHQDAAEMGTAAFDSPLILSVTRAVELMAKVLHLQATYLNLVRPAIKMRQGQRGKPVCNGAVASFEDSIMNHLELVKQLGRCCGVGCAPLTLASLHLLQKISTSPRIISAWDPSGARHGLRNKAIVALEKDGDAEAVARSLSSDMASTLDFSLEADSPAYEIKIVILDFLFECLKASPNQPSIAHCLLGFKCGLDSLAVQPRGGFDQQSSLFHCLLDIFLVLPHADDKGVRGWLTRLKCKTLRIFQVLWASPLSSALVLNELRETSFLFHLLLGGFSGEPEMARGQVVVQPAHASLAYLDFLSLRAMVFAYLGQELCSVAQLRIPALKRRILDALNGRIEQDDGSILAVPDVFDLYDSFLPCASPGLDLKLAYYKDLDLDSFLEQDPDAGFLYNTARVQQVLMLKRKEASRLGHVISEAELLDLESDEAEIQQYLAISNRQAQLLTTRRNVLRSWANLVLVMLESNEFKGAARTSFLLQALQAVLPKLDMVGIEHPTEALELAKVARALLFKFDFAEPEKHEHVAAPGDSMAKARDGATLSNLTSDKLFQLFQICTRAISKWTDSPELRSVYYGICYRYLASIADATNNRAAGLDGARAVRTMRSYGERLWHMVCDDACGSDATCQTAAMVLLGAAVRASDDDEAGVVDSLNRLNFVAVLVDSLRTVLDDWLDGRLECGASVPRQPAVHVADIADNYTAAKLALLLQLCRTRKGATLVLQAGLFRAVEASRAFRADPELEPVNRLSSSPSSAAPMAGVDPLLVIARHYALLASLVRIVAAALVVCGAHHVVQGRRFLQRHKLLVVDALKKSERIGAGAASNMGESSAGVMELERRVREFAECAEVLVTVTGFVDVKENENHDPFQR